MSRTSSAVLARLALVALLTIGVLAGPSITPVRHAAAASPMTLTFYEYNIYQADPRTKAVVKQYEQLHPGVTVKYAPFSTNVVVDLSSALQGGTAADVIIPTVMQQVWNDVPKGYYTDLTTYLTKQPDPYTPGHVPAADTILPGALKQERFLDGKLWCLSGATVDSAFFYNMDIFNKLHLTPPQTWAQLIAMLPVIKKAGYVPFQYALGDSVYGDAPPGLFMALENMTMDRHILAMDTNHDGIVDLRELVAGIHKGLYSAHNGDMQEVFKLMKGLYPYMEPGAAGFNFTQDQAAFARGRAAMNYTGIFYSIVLDNAHVPFKYGYFLVPQVTSASSSYATPGIKGTGTLGPNGSIPYCIPTTTVQHHHLAQAVDFIQYLLDRHNIDVVDAANTNLSVVKGGQNPSRFQVFEEASTHPARTFVAELTLPTSFETGRAQLLQAYLTGQQSLSQVSDALQKLIVSAADEATRKYHL
jgi:ABC-type glycerol-3-phosphate transport system substrate-binding protein